MENKRYAGNEGWTVSECAAKVAKDWGKVDVLVHSLANGPEVTKALLDTSRAGYLAASSASAYSVRAVAWVVRAFYYFTHACPPLLLVF